MRGKAVDGVCLGFIKAFDFVSHNILLEKLAALGMVKCTLCWVKNCLDGQTRGWCRIQLVFSHKCSGLGVGASFV